MVIVIGIKNINNWIMFSVSVDMGKWYVFSEEFVNIMMFCNLYLNGIINRNSWINLVIVCFLVNSVVIKFDSSYNSMFINNC